MTNLITSTEVAAMFGVSLNLFNSARLGVGAPDPVLSERQRNPDTGRMAKMIVLYDVEQCREWAKDHDFWQLAMDYRHRQRHGDQPRVRTAARRGPKTKIDITGRSAELIERDAAVALHPLVKDFLLGKFAPAPVRVAQDMKLLRARLNKPKTTRVSVNVDGGW